MKIVELLDAHVVHFELSCSAQELGLLPLC
jgi:hypothetical protein